MIHLLPYLRLSVVTFRGPGGTQKESWRPGGMVVAMTQRYINGEPTIFYFWDPPIALKVALWVRCRRAECGKRQRGTLE